MKKYLIITAHPDDAEIAMGGTIMKLVSQGHAIKNFVCSIPNFVELRIKETELSSSFMQIEHQFIDHTFPCGVEEISMYYLVSQIDKCIEEFQPDAVFTHWDQDSHQDHCLVSRAVQIALRRQHFELYFFEQTNQNNLLKSNLFVPNVYVDITYYIEKKIQAVALHRSQLQGYMKHYLDDIEMLGKWRGYQIKVQFAESFKLMNKKEIY